MQCTFDELLGAGHAVDALLEQATRLDLNHAVYYNGGHQRRRARTPVTQCQHLSARAGACAALCGIRTSRESKGFILR